MSEKKIFKATKQEYGDNIVKYMDKSLPLNSALRVGFDWGNTGAGARQLATAILKEASNQTIARIYTTKYTNAIVKNLKKDNWTLPISEVQKWINDNTEYSVEEDNSQEQEKQRLKKIEVEKLRLKQEDEKKKKEVEEIFQREKEKKEEEQKLKLRRDKEIKAKKVEEARAKKDKLDDDKKIKEELATLKKEKLLQEQKYEEELKQKEKELLSAKEKAVKSQDDDFDFDFDDENIIEIMCDELDISQDKLGKILGVTRHTVQNWKLENEIPKLAKKAIEFYQQYIENQDYKKIATQSQEELEEYKQISIQYQDDLDKSKKMSIQYQDEIDECKQDIEKYQNEIKKYKKIENLHSDKMKNYKQEMQKYKDIVSMLDIPSLYERYSTLDGVDKA